jgi:hypothetical protein
MVDRLLERTIQISSRVTCYSLHKPWYHHGHDEIYFYFCCSIIIFYFSKLHVFVQGAHVSENFNQDLIIPWQPRIYYLYDVTLHARRNLRKHRFETS